MHHFYYLSMSLSLWRGECINSLYSGDSMRNVSHRSIVIAVTNLLASIVLPIIINPQ